MLDVSDDEINASGKATINGLAIMNISSAY